MHCKGRVHRLFAGVIYFTFILQTTIFVFFLHKTCNILHHEQFDHKGAAHSVGIDSAGYGGFQRCCPQGVYGGRNNRFAWMVPGGGCFETDGFRA